MSGRVGMKKGYGKRSKLRNHPPVKRPSAKRKSRKNK
jgi:hypothetical protein